MSSIRTASTLLRSAPRFANTTASRASSSVRPTAASCRFLSTKSAEGGALQYPAVPKGDYGEYQEYSVIFTNRSLNLMSKPFQQVMRDLNDLLKATYNAHKVAIMPGGPNLPNHFLIPPVTFCNRPPRHEQIRNLWHGSSSPPIRHRQTRHGHPQRLVLLPLDRDLRHGRALPRCSLLPHRPQSPARCPRRPRLPPHALRLLPAVHVVGGLFVLDCIASGAIWADMKDLGVDAVISAPQKGWTGPACCALVMLSEKAAEKMAESQETSFSMSLKRWSAIMDTYEKGGFGYHTTMPTDGLRDFHEISVETLNFGMPELKAAQYKLGADARALLDSRGLTSVAAPGFQAPGVLVYYSPMGQDNPTMMNKFKDHGLQIAMGVPWRIDEPSGLNTFRLGLFGLDKMGNIPKCVATLEMALDALLAETGHVIPEKKVA
ncbi:hypothetical protein ACHAXS_001221 [Conticribra weissflogii]